MRGQSRRNVAACRIEFVLSFLVKIHNKLFLFWEKLNSKLFFCGFIDLRRKMMYDVEYMYRIQSG